MAQFSGELTKQTQINAEKNPEKKKGLLKQLEKLKIQKQIKDLEMKKQNI